MIFSSACPSIDWSVGPSRTKAVAVAPTAADGDGDAANKVNEAHSDSEKSDRECGICKESVIRCSDQQVEALFCGHVFHTECISKVWSVGNWPHGSCPYRCRHVPVEIEGDNRVSDHAAPEWELIDDQGQEIDQIFSENASSGGGNAAASSSSAVAPAVVNSGPGMLL